MPFDLPSFWLAADATVSGILIGMDNQTGGLNLAGALSSGAPRRGEVPLPAGRLLLLGGLGPMGRLRRR